MLQIICENTKDVISCDRLPECKLSTLEFVISHGGIDVYEWDLFRACCWWSKKRENPRQSLGNILRHIRFREIRWEDIAFKREPEQLLTTSETTDILHCLSRNSTGKCDMPPGFANDIRSGCLSLLVKEQIYISFANYGLGMYIPAEDIYSQKIRICTSNDIWILGVKLSAFNQDKSFCAENYQSIILTLRHVDNTVEKVVGHKLQDIQMNCCDVKFGRPYRMLASYEYWIRVTFPRVKSTYYCKLHPQQTLKTKADTEIRLLEDVVFLYNWQLILSEYKH
jgi:hypothetical protein